MVGNPRRGKRGKGKEGKREKASSDCLVGPIWL
jgi:hypothetical protein